MTIFAIGNVTSDFGFEICHGLVDVSRASFLVKKKKDDGLKDGSRRVKIVL